MCREISLRMTLSGGLASNHVSVSDDEVLGHRVMADYCERRLFGMELEALAHRDPDTAGFEELHDLRVVLEIRAGRVTERIPATTVLLAEKTGQRRGGLCGEFPLLAEPPAA